MKTHRTARVQKVPLSPFWYADFEVWNAKRGQWVRTFKTTKVRHSEPPLAARKREALAIADEMQRLACEAVDVPRGVSREWAAEAVHSLLRAAGGTSSKTERQSWKDFSAGWLAAIKSTVSFRTHESYESHLRTFSRGLGERVKWPVDGFDRSDIQAWYDGVAGERSEKTTNNILKTVAMAFQEAVDQEIITRNPCDGVKRRHAADVIREREPFGVEEIDDMLAACAHVEHGDEWRTMILLAMTTGAREGDCAKMGRTHLDTSDDVWLLRFRQQKLIGKGSKAMVTAPVVGPLREHLAKWLKSSKDLLFCPNLSTLPIGGNRGLSMRFREIIERAGVLVRTIAAQGSKGRPWRDKGFHSFRHTLPSWLAAHGVDERVAMAILGHHSKGVHRGYTHHNLTKVAGEIQRALPKQMRVVK